MIDLKTDFRKWLVNQELSKSTIYDYLSAINRVRKKEGHISWETLAVNLFSIIPDYQGKYKTILHKYNEFLFEADLYACIRQERYNNILCALSLDESGRIIIEENKDFYTPGEAATLLRVCERTLARWRQKKIGPEYRKDNNKGKITYPKPCLEKYLNESLNKI